MGRKRWSGESFTGLLSMRDQEEKNPRKDPLLGTCCTRANKKACEN